MWHTKHLGKVVLAVVLVSSGGLAAVALAASAGTLNLAATLRLAYVRIACPPGVPNDGRGCDRATGTSRIRGLGTVSVDELVSFVNGRDDVVASGTLTVGSRGSISFAYAGGFRLGSFTITGGTGAFAGAGGSGTINGIDVGRPDSSIDHYPQQWAGSMTAPAVEFDTTPPHLSVGKALVQRSGDAKYRIRIPFRASDDAGGAIAYELVLRGGVKTVRATGSNATAVTVSVRTAPTTRRLSATLTVYDDRANPATASLETILRR